MTTRRKARRMRIKYNACRRALRWYQSQRRRAFERSPWQVVYEDSIARSLAVGWFARVMGFGKPHSAAWQAINRNTR